MFPGWMEWVSLELSGVGGLHKRKAVEGHLVGMGVYMVVGMGGGRNAWGRVEEV